MPLAALVAHNLNVAEVEAPRGGAAANPPGVFERIPVPRLVKASVWIHVDVHTEVSDVVVHSATAAPVEAHAFISDPILYSTALTVHTLSTSVTSPLIGTRTGVDADSEATAGAAALLASTRTDIPATVTAMETDHRMVRRRRKEEELLLMAACFLD